MNKIDEKVLKIFNSLLDGKFKYTVDYSTLSLEFTIKGEKVQLFIKNIPSASTIEPNKHTTIKDVSRNIYDYLGYCYSAIDTNLRFSFALRINGRIYNVPELNRIDEATALTRIEELVAEYEEDTLQSILDSVNERNIVEEDF